MYHTIVTCQLLIHGNWLSIASSAIVYLLRNRPRLDVLCYDATPVALWCSSMELYHSRESRNCGILYLHLYVDLMWGKDDIVVNALLKRHCIAVLWPVVFCSLLAGLDNRGIDFDQLPTYKLEYSVRIRLPFVLALLYHTVYLLFKKYLVIV